MYSEIGALHIVASSNMNCLLLVYAKGAINGKCKGTSSFREKGTNSHGHTLTNVLFRTSVKCRGQNN